MISFLVSSTISAVTLNAFADGAMLAASVYLAARGAKRRKR